MESKEEEIPKTKKIGRFFDYIGYAYLAVLLFTLFFSTSIPGCKFQENSCPSHGPFDANCVLSYGYVCEPGLPQFVHVAAVYTSSFWVSVIGYKIRLGYPQRAFTVGPSNLFISIPLNILGLLCLLRLEINFLRRRFKQATKSKPPTPETDRELS